jgi:hypothetical protein
MPSSNDNKPNSEKDWFDRLPRKLRIVLLMLFTVAVTAIFFFSGLRLLHTGESSNYAGHEFSAGECFLWSSFGLGITGLLAAAYMGWFKGSKEDSPQ